MAGPFNWISQVASITAFSVRTLPQRIGSSLTALLGIAGVVAVMVAGAVALAVFEHRDLHVPQARSEAYGDLAGADLTGADLRGADLSGARVEGASFADADLRGTALDGALGEPATEEELEFLRRKLIAERQRRHLDTGPGRVGFLQKAGHDLVDSGEMLQVGE